MKNKSVYFIYDAVNCTPNGDPDTGEQRYNENSKKAVVSDLRIKRFGRDKLNDIGENVYYFYDWDRISSNKKSASSKKSDSDDTDSKTKDKNTGSGAAIRFNLFCKENGIKDNDSKKILLQHFVDVRVFGGILTAKNKAQVTGALQFDAETDSVNEVVIGKNFINRGITTVFPSGGEKGQGGMGRDSYLRYGLFCVKGRVSATTAKHNTMTDNDLKLVLSAIWDGMKTINTRSKYGHQPIACIVVEHPTQETKNGYLGKTFSKSFTPFEIKTDKKMSELYSRADYEFDFSPLISKFGDADVDSVTIYCDDNNFIQKYFANLPKNCEVLNPFDTLVTLI